MAFRSQHDVVVAADQPQVGQGEDIARSAQTGLTEGLSQVAGAFGDIRGAAQGAVDAGLAFANRHGATLPSHIDLPVPQQMRVLGDAAGAIARTAGVNPALARLALAITSPGGLAQAPTSQDVQRGATKGKPLYQPQTAAGKYTRTITQFAPAATMPGGLVRRAANVVLPGGAAEAAGQATAGTKLEPYARIAAAVAGGGLANLATSPGPRTRILAEAARGASDAQVGQARDLMQTAQHEGVQLTLAEALQQVTGGGTGMGRLQRVVEGTKAGAERFAPVMAQRPEQVRGALVNYADALAPATTEPSMIGGRAQQGADGALNDVRRFINSFAEPHYDALVGQEIPAGQYAPLAGNASYREALGALRAHPELGAQVAHLPDNNLAVVNEVVKRLNTTAEQARPGPMNPQGDNGLAALRDTAAGTAAQVASDASPDFAAARQGVAAGRQTYLEPLQRGPLGQISATDSVKGQTAALYPSQPLEGGADETARAVELLNGQDPSIAPDLTRQFLTNSANEATQQLQPGPNAWGGAKWAATNAGNPEQERALMAGVEGSGGDTGRLQSIIDVLRATGKRQAPGSLTAYNAKDLEELGKAGALGEALRTGMNPPGMFRRLGLGFQDWQTERNAGHLADAILANPQDAEAIVLRARQVVPDGEALQQIERLGMAVQLPRGRQLEGP